MAINTPRRIDNQPTQPAIARVVLQQRAPGHRQYQRRYVQRRIAAHQARVVAFEQCGSRRQGHDQIVLLREGHRRLVVAGKYPNLAFPADFIQRGVDPAEALHIVRVHAHTHAHAGLAHPDVVGSQVVLQGEVVEDRMPGAEQTREAVLPERYLVKALGHGIEAIDHHVYLAPFHVEKAHIGGRHNVQGKTRSLAAQGAQNGGKQSGLGVVAGHDPEHLPSFARDKFRARLHRAVDVRQCVAHQGRQFQGALRWRHTLRGAHQQRVAEQLAQAAQAVAHGRLGQIQLLRRLGHAALAQQRIQVDQKIQIDTM